MDKLINFLLLIIVFVVVVTFLFNKSSLEYFGFGFSDIDRYNKHTMDIKERKYYNLFVEDDKLLLLNNPKLNKPLRDVNELMNFTASDSKDIYDLLGVDTKKRYNNLMGFW